MATDWTFPASCLRNTKFLFWVRLELSLFWPVMPDGKKGVTAIFLNHSTSTINSVWKDDCKFNLKMFLQQSEMVKDALFFFSHNKNSEAHVKTIEKSFNDVLQQKNCTITVKDHLYMCIKTEPEQKYSRQMHQNLQWILIHTLKTPTQPFSSVLQWPDTGVRLVFCCFFFWLFFHSFSFVVKWGCKFLPQDYQVMTSMMETRTLYIRRTGKTRFYPTAEQKKKTNLGHIPVDEPKAQSSSVSAECFFFVFCFFKYTIYVHSWWGVFFVCFFVPSILVEKSHGHLGCKLRTHTGRKIKTPKKNIEKYYILNLPRVRQFCN